MCKKPFEQTQRSPTTVVLNLFWLVTHFSKKKIFWQHIFNTKYHDLIRIGDKFVCFYIEMKYWNYLATHRRKPATHLCVTTPCLRNTDLQTKVGQSSFCLSRFSLFSSFEKMMKIVTSYEFSVMLTSGSQRLVIGVSCIKIISNLVTHKSLYTTKTQVLSSCPQSKSFNRNNSHKICFGNYVLHNLQ